MPKKKKDEEKLPKYFEADEKVKPVLEKVLKECADTFSSLAEHEMKLLFTGDKYKAGRKPIKIKFIRQPYNFISKNEKVFLLINFEYWDGITETDRIKILIEALLGLSLDDDGEYQKRDYDIVTYRELLKDAKEDYSRFKKVLPAEGKKAENLDVTYLNLD